MPHVIVVKRGGLIRTLYTDRLPLRRFGKLTVSRASFVEWKDDVEGWTVQFADLTYLPDAADPTRAAVFANREEALRAEVAAINASL